MIQLICENGHVNMYAVILGQDTCPDCGSKKLFHMSVENEGK